MWYTYIHRIDYINYIKLHFDEKESEDVRPQTL
jgi:hypothetical protein